MNEAMQENQIKATTPSPLKNFIIGFIMPTLVGKTFVVYFGLNYSESPGEGYGYGLVAAIAFTVVNLLRLAWRYRNTEDL